MAVTTLSDGTVESKQIQSLHNVELKTIHFKPPVIHYGERKE